MQFVRFMALTMVVLAAALVAVAKDGIGPSYFDAIGKSIFWSIAALYPLLTLSQDVLRLAVGKIVALALIVVQGVLVFCAFGKLQDLNFIVLTPLCLIQAVVFALPLMLIRKRHTGIWY